MINIKILCYSSKEDMPEDIRNLISDNDTDYRDGFLAIDDISYVYPDNENGNTCIKLKSSEEIIVKESPVEINELIKQEKIDDKITQIYLGNNQ